MCNIRISQSFMYFAYKNMKTHDKKLNNLKNYENKKNITIENYFKKNFNGFFIDY